MSDQTDPSGVVQAGDPTPSPLTLATKVTLARIVGTPVFIGLMVYYILSLKHQQPAEIFRYAAIAIFFLVAVTDALDGYLARKRHETSRLGRILDPLADKFLVLSTLVVFTQPSLPSLQPQFPVWFTILVFSREVVLVAGALLIHLYTGQVHIDPHWSGKLATVLLMICVGWALCGFSTTLFSPLLAAAAFFTALAWIQYLIDGVRQLEQAGGDSLLLTIETRGKPPEKPQ